MIKWIDDAGYINADGKIYGVPVTDMDLDSF